MLLTQNYTKRLNNLPYETSDIASMYRYLLKAIRFDGSFTPLIAVLPRYKGRYFQLKWRSLGITLFSAMYNCLFNIPMLTIITYICT